jgi:hypothetical protein
MAGVRQRIFPEEPDFHIPHPERTLMEAGIRALTQELH